MKIPRGSLVSTAFVLVGLGVAVWLWPRLPAQVPVHWGPGGHVDGYGSRFWAATMAPLGVLALAVLTWLLPAISPNRFRIDPFRRVFTGVMLVVQGFVLVVGVSVLLAGAGYAVPIPKIAMLGLGVLVTVIGNYMGKLQRNFFAGIRTPWTLASEATWERTHRLAGKLFVVAGLVVLMGTAVGLPVRIGIGCVLAAALISVVASYFIYRRVEGAPRG